MIDSDIEKITPKQLNPSVTFHLDNLINYHQYVLGHAPHKGGVVQLQHHHKAQGDEEQAQVKQHHQTTYATGVGAARVWRGHRLHHQLPAPRRLRLNAHLVARPSPSAICILTVE